MTYYMHTVDGKPGSFDGSQISYALGRSAARVVTSRREIGVERRKSIRYRLRHGWDVPEYAYVLVKLPE